MCILKMYRVALVLCLSVWMVNAYEPCGGRVNIVIAVPVRSIRHLGIFQQNLIDLVQYLKIGRDHARFDLLVYGSDTMPLLFRSERQTRTLIEHQFRRLGDQQFVSPSISQGLDLVKAIVRMGDTLAYTPRDVKKIGIIFTEGPISSNRIQGQAVIDAAKRLHDSGTIVYNLGSNISQAIGKEFESIGSDRCRLFSMGDFSTGLRAAIPYLANSICAELDPNKKITPENCFPDMCNGRANIVLAVPGEAGQISETFEYNLIDLLSYFNIDQNNIRIGLILYGDQSVTILTPNEYKNRTQVNTRITLMNHRSLYYDQLGYGNDLANALRQMQDIFRLSKHIPGNARDIGIVFTTDQINSTVSEGDDIINLALELKRFGALMYNVGSNISQESAGVFEYVGTDRCRLFSMDNFTDILQDAVPFIASGICSELDPSQRVSPQNCYPKNYFKFLPRKFSCPSKVPAMPLADPNNCAYFYQCSYADPKLDPERKLCSPGTLFDPSPYLNTCNVPTFVSCYTD